MPEMTCTNHPEAEGSIVRCMRCLQPFCSDCLVRIGGRPVCGDCKVEQLRDAASGVNTGSLELASMGRRFAALFIDGLIVGLPIMAIIFAVIIPSALKSGGRTPEVPNWLNVIGYLQIPVMIVYEALMLGRSGQTLGKSALRLRVVNPDGGQITSSQAWRRAAVRSLMASLLAIINYLPAFFTKEKTPLHDMAAKTRVIYLG